MMKISNKKQYSPSLIVSCQPIVKHTHTNANDVTVMIA